MQNLLTSFVDLASSLNKVMALPSINLIDPLITDKGRKWNVKSGDKVRYRLGRLTDIGHNLPATHQIIRCKGNITSSILQIDLEDLQTKEILTFNLK